MVKCRLSCVDVISALVLIRFESPTCKIGEHCTQIALQTDRRNFVYSVYVSLILWPSSHERRARKGIKASYIARPNHLYS
jgi:hypothetical protein